MFDAVSFTRLCANLVLKKWIFFNEKCRHQKIEISILKIAWLPIFIEKRSFLILGKKNAKILISIFTENRKQGRNSSHWVTTLPSLRHYLSQFGGDMSCGRVDITFLIYSVTSCMISMPHVTTWSEGEWLHGWVGGWFQPISPPCRSYKRFRWKYIIDLQWPGLTCVSTQPNITSRGIFRTQSNICNVAFFAKIVNG